MDKKELDTRYDWVGPVDKVSKIRPIRLRRVENESDSERVYREAREKLNEWNCDFWSKHNKLFENRKAQFYEERQKPIGGRNQMSANELSVFYKDFLNEQSSSFSAYNNEWYRRNIQLIWPAMRASFVRFKRILGR
uniref:Apoptogenic protein 1 n=1 Tax=Ditylenchus dipsaci TaxID=166011 RepID=A0A915DIM4_9BILA